MNRNDTLQFLEAAEALLAAHKTDIELHGAARPQAQREFARIAYGALEEACELVRELVAELNLKATALERQRYRAQVAEDRAAGLEKQLRLAQGKAASRAGRLR